MSMVFCPECGSRISSAAITCPHCGFSAPGTEIVPISLLPPVARTPVLVIPDASVFDDGGSLVTREANDSIVRFLRDAETMGRLAPNVAEFIEGMMARGETKYVADFSKAAEELIEKGELVLSVDKKTKELLPQVRSVSTGQIFEKARIHIEDVPNDLMPSVNAIQAQVMMAQIMGEIESVAANVEGLRLELQADRIARAESAWQQLQQAVSIRDSRLRESKILGIAAKATEARCSLEGNFRTNLQLAASRQGKVKDWSQAADRALIDLSVISLMARTEYASYCLLGEEDAAREALGQFRSFVLESRLDDRETLLRINASSRQDRKTIVDGFARVAKNVARMELGDGAATQDKAPLLPGSSDDEEAS